MDGVIAWLGFVGGWLLFAGPVYQAALELQEEGFERSRLEAVSSRVPKRGVSPWWWLLPPVAYVLQRRRAQAHQTAVIAAMPHQDVEMLMAYMNKALGWLIVGAGGLLLAVRETWDLTEHYDWPTAVFVVLIVALALLAVLNAALRIRLAERVIAEHARDHPSQ
jgi:uncharacterized membrane protein YiaA